MRSIAYTLPALPGFAGPKTYAAWPVWRDSIRAEVRFVPISKKEAARRWHKARRHESATHEPGKHGGAIGRPAMAVLYALLFDFLDHRTGQLDPSYAAIARKAGICRRAVATALKRLRELRLLHWQRRCAENQDEAGRFRLRQETNAYAVLPPSHWRGYREPPEPPLPEPWQLGAVPPLPEGAAAAVAVRAAGGSIEAALPHLIESEDPAQAALGRLFADILSREGNTPGFTGVQRLQRTPARSS